MMFKTTLDDVVALAVRDPKVSPKGRAALEVYLASELRKHIQELQGIADYLDPPEPDVTTQTGEEK